MSHATLAQPDYQAQLGEVGLAEISCKREFYGRCFLGSPYTLAWKEGLPIKADMVHSGVPPIHFYL
jgi:hypothetical protein